MNALLDSPNSYKLLDRNPLPKMQSSFNHDLKLLAEKFPDFKHFILTFKSFLPSLPYAYGLPKIHKVSNPLRPIISFCNSPSYSLAKK